MSGKLKKILNSEITIFSLYHAVRGYAATYRLTVENEHVWMDHMKAGGSVIICCWHQQFFSAIRHFRNYSHLKPPLMISRSSDGGLIAGIAGRTGWDPVRGSSSKGGRDALSEIAQKLLERKIAAHIVDGPRGPAGKIKAGIIRLAQLGNAAIIPFSVHADRAWYFKSWDRFMVPKPFAKVTLRFDELFPIPSTSTPEEFEDVRLKLEEIMLPGLICP